MNGLSQLPAEMLAQQISNGFILMGLGLGVVFGFLILLIICTKLVSKVIISVNSKNSVSPKVETVKAKAVEAKPASVATVAAPARVVTTATAPKATVSGDVKAPMPGLILKMNVKVGDYVEANQMLLVMEAMKMENEIYAPKAGKVEKICVQLGQQLEADDLLLVIAGNSPSISQPAVSAPVVKPAASPKKTSDTPAPSAEPKPFALPQRRTNLGPARVQNSGLKPSPRTLSSKSAVTTTNTPVASAVCSAKGATVKAPMAGTVLRLSVKEGDVVKKNQQLMVLEAMKMENEIFSPVDGTVKVIHVKQGTALEADDLMIELG